MGGALHDVDVIAGCDYLIGVAGRLQKRVVPLGSRLGLYVHGAVTVFQQGTYFRRTSLHNVNGLNSENIIAWGGELSLDMALSGARFARISDDLALFRLHDSSITGSGGHSNVNELRRPHRERIILRTTAAIAERSIGPWTGVAHVVKWASDPTYLVERMSAASDRSRRARRDRNTVARLDEIASCHLAHQPRRRGPDREQAPAAPAAGGELGVDVEIASCDAPDAPWLASGGLPIYAFGPGSLSYCYNRAAYLLAKKNCETTGGRIVNCTEGGSLKIYERTPLDQFVGADNSLTVQSRYSSAD